MSFRRWQKLIAARMPKAVPPAVLMRASVEVDSFRAEGPARGETN